MIRIGQKLRDARTEKGLTLEEVSKATKIRVAFLEALEKGDYKNLPSSAYAHGFVKNYAEFLGLPQKETVALFKREFDEREYLGVLPKNFTDQDDITLSGFKFRQTSLIVVLIFIVLVGYLGFQYRYAFFNPPLDITSPKEGQTVSQDVTVIGKTDLNAIAVVNDNPTTVDQDGNFSKSVTLFPGKATIIVRVQNRFGKQTRLERHVNVQE
jgi:cytoskeletal protein RodZ